MTELIIDVPRLRKELEYVTTHREQWHQGTWVHRTACGTIACLAGNTALNAGYRPVWSRHDSTTTARFALGDRFAHPADVAAELLGLTSAQESRLFDASNTLYDLWRIAEELTDGEIQVPPHVLDEELRNVPPPPSGMDLAATNDAEGLRLRRAHHERARRRRREAYELS